MTKLSESRICDWRVSSRDFVARVTARQGLVEMLYQPWQKGKCQRKELLL